MSPSAAWRPIGHVLVESGAISQDELELALAEQRRSGRRLGEILIDSGRITWLTLANAIAEQASDMEPGAAPAPAPESEPESELPPAAAEAPVPAAEPGTPTVPAAVEPPLSNAPAPPLTVDTPPSTGDPTGRLETVEAMLKERQRAFLELVSVTERLRANVSRLQEQVDERDAEIMKLRARVNGSVSAA